MVTLTKPEVERLLIVLDAVVQVDFFYDHPADQENRDPRADDLKWVAEDLIPFLQEAIGETC